MKTAYTYKLYLQRVVSSRCEAGWAEGGIPACNIGHIVIQLVLS